MKLPPTGTHTKQALHLALSTTHLKLQEWVFMVPTLQTEKLRLKQERTGPQPKFKAKSVS